MTGSLHFFREIKEGFKKSVDEDPGPGQDDQDRDDVREE